MLFILAGAACSRAQISPPGLDGARVVTWGALGFNQKLSSRWSVTGYVGGSRQSDPDSYNTMKKGGILVIDQATMYAFNPTWQLAFCTSFRSQGVYEEEQPYEKQDPGVRDELRYYLRLYYKRQTGRVAWTYSFRPEYRTFYTTNWERWSTPLELRFRLKAQAAIALNASKSNQVILANEILTAVDEYETVTDTHGRWSAYHFTEDRFTNYFRHTFKKPAVVLDAGLMHQVWKDKENNAHYTMYLALDLLFQNPFGVFKEKKGA